MTSEEKRDVYIAAGVGGVALVLILLYVHSAPAPGQPGALPDATQAAIAGDQNPYNYNIQPYGGSGSPLYVPPNGAVQAGGSNSSSNGCCDPCASKNGGYQNPGVLAYLKLLALGA